MENVKTSVYPLQNLFYNFLARNIISRLAVAELYTVELCRSRCDKFTVYQYYIQWLDATANVVATSELLSCCDICCSNYVLDMPTMLPWLLL